MSEDIYSAPESELTSEADERSSDYYVVSLKKFTVLFLATLSVYSVYWFYKNWRIIKVRQGLSIWPVPRAIFDIFFTHSLFRKVESDLKDKHNEDWEGGTVATVYVVAAIASNVFDSLAERFIGSAFADVIFIAILYPLWWSLYSAQQKINIICGDLNGESNSDFSAANMIFILLGFVLWAAVVLGLLISFNVVPEGVVDTLFSL